jgi:hypothetical protein
MSANTSAYCQARARLPEETLEALHHQLGVFCLTPRKGIVGHHAARVISQSMGIPANP